MSISKYPSKVSLPQVNRGWTTVLDFLTEHFSAIDKSIWQQRMLEGKVHWADKSLIHHDTPYQAQRSVFYYREVLQESKIPFQHSILFQNEHILVADKPHFLPVTPGGQYVNECLQHRLREDTCIEQLQALHRLDRETAGLVMFSVNPESRSKYHALFAEKKITKTYLAIAKTSSKAELQDKEWAVKNKMIKAKPSFLMQIDSKAQANEFNSHSIIKCAKQHSSHSLFELKPITGKTHQLRVHMQSIGSPIVNDKFYPELQAKTEEDYKSPLQLLANELSFIDPITNQPLTFKSELTLDLVILLS